MHNQESLIQKVAQVKAVMDNGFCRVGPGLDSRKRADGIVVGNASRCVALADSVVQLCRSEHPDEAVLPLFALAGQAVGLLCLLASKEPDRLAETLLRELSEGDEPLWPAERLLERGRQAGVPDEELRQTLALAKLPGLAGRSKLPWCHVYKENSRAGTDGAIVLGLACRWMERVLKGLDARWPGSFVLTA